MDLRIDVPWILRVAEIAGAGDPAADDYGLLVAAVACHKAELLGQPVYDGPYARAAALVHILGRCRWLKHSNMAVAAATGVMYLEVSGIPVKPTREDSVALRDLLRDSACTAAKIAVLLRSCCARSSMVLANCTYGRLQRALSTRADRRRWLRSPRAAERASGHVHRRRSSRGCIGTHVRRCAGPACGHQRLSAALDGKPERAR